jgi:hypothetical protein
MNRLPQAILRDIANGDIEAPPEMVEKARHALRDADTGKFRRMNDHVDNIPDGSGLLPMQHSGAVLPQLRRST